MTTLFPAFLALENKDLELVIQLIDELRADLWIVTHIYLHRTEKVKACSDLIKKGIINTINKYLISKVIPSSPVNNLH